jgi:HEAT repeat protein
VRALTALQEVLERDQDLMMRRAATNGLRLLQMPETIPVFSTMLADKQDDRFVRMSAAYGLAQLGEAQGVTGLMQIFDEAEQDGSGRFVAFRALTSLNDPAALPLMRQLAVSDADVSCGRHAVSG